MKKIFPLVLVTALCISLKAQNVTPLNVVIVEYNLDTVRHYAGNDAQYVVELKNLTQRVKTDKDALNLAIKTAKSERNYYKAQVKLNKQRKSQLSKQEKIYKNQEKADKKEQKEIDKQRKALLKDAALDQQILADNNASLEQREARLRDKENERSHSIQGLQHEREILKDDMIALSSYDLDLKDKEAKLKNMQQTNKLQDKMLKNEIKATNAKINANKKMAKLQAN